MEPPIDREELWRVRWQADTRERYLDESNLVVCSPDASTAVIVKV